MRLARILVGVTLLLAAATAGAQSPGNFSTLSTTGTATLGGDALMCSGHPWLDVKCPSLSGGAIGDGSHDDTAAIQTAINTAITNNWPLHIPAGTYKVTGAITIDYAGQAASGFRLISAGATLDGRTIASGPVLQVQCGGGTTGSPANCFYFHEEGTLFVTANTPGYAFVLGKSDFSDAHNSLKLDHVSVNNASTNAAAGACQFNYVLDSDISSICVSAGGGAGIALEQTQFSRISGAATAAGTGGRGLVLENGFDFSNIFFALDLEVSPICLSITMPHDGQNTFVSPYFNCATAVSATASTRNLLINPNYGGNVVNRGPQSAGIRVIGTGNRVPWQFPAAASYTAAGIDDNTELLAYQTATLTAAHKYNLTYLRRGVYGTPIGAHSSGANFARFGPNDPSLFKYAYPQSFIGQTIHLKLPGFNIFGQGLQSLAGLTADTYTLTGAGAVAPVNVPFQYLGIPQAGSPILRYTFADPVSFATNFAGSTATAGAAATAATIFDIAKNGSNFATLTFAAAAGTGTFSGPAQSVIAGDVLTVTARTTDATLANLSGVLTGTG